MSSSGIIYAVIVGAWAVYLVPMWLRREDELNRVRQTQRYAAAIKVLANKEAFERRWAQPGEADEALPLAAGQGSAPISAPVSVSTSASTPRAGKRTSGTVTKAPQEMRGPSSPAAAKPAKRPTVAAATASAATATRNVVTANIAAADTRATRTARSRAATPSAATPASTAQRRSAAGLKAPVARTRTGLMARRRRVVALLFTISTFGALVSADLGARYLWVMAIPAVLLSAYIARLRREERIRAAARAAKYAAAQEARAAREAELARAEAADAEAARLEAAQAEAAHAQVRADAEQRRRAESARRRSSAAARARAQAFTHEAPDFRQASNG